jgi:hypothetical protein
MLVEHPALDHGPSSMQSKSARHTQPPTTTDWMIGVGEHPARQIRLYAVSLGHTCRPAHERSLGMRRCASTGNQALRASRLA